MVDVLAEAPNLTRRHGFVWLLLPKLLGERIPLGGDRLKLRGGRLKLAVQLGDEGEDGGGVHESATCPVRITPPLSRPLSISFMAPALPSIHMAISLLFSSASPMATG